jgi:hypothetical protein
VEREKWQREPVGAVKEEKIKFPVSLQQQQAPPAGLKYFPEGADGRH